MIYTLEILQKNVQEQLLFLSNEVAVAVSSVKDLSHSYGQIVASNGVDLTGGTKELVVLKSRAAAAKQRLKDLKNEINELALICIRKTSNMRLPINQQLEEERAVFDLLADQFVKCLEMKDDLAEQMVTVSNMAGTIDLTLRLRAFEARMMKLCLQGAKVCFMVSAIISAIFVMNMRSSLENNLIAFWGTAGVLMGISFSLFIGFLKWKRLL